MKKYKQLSSITSHERGIYKHNKKRNALLDDGLSNYIFTNLVDANYDRCLAELYLIEQLEDDLAISDVIFETKGNPHSI